MQEGVAGHANAPQDTSTSNLLIPPSSHPRNPLRLTPARVLRDPGRLAVRASYPPEVDRGTVDCYKRTNDRIVDLTSGFWTEDFPADGTH